MRQVLYQLLRQWLLLWGEKMKTLITDYTFNAAAKQITFNSTIPDGLESVLLITNVTDGIIIYNFADPTCGGALAGNVLGLTYNTTAMSNTDALQIFIDVPNTDHDELTDILRVGLVEIVRQLQSIRNDSGMTDPTGRMRVAIEASSTVPVSQSTLATVTNLTNIGGYSAAYMNISPSNASAKQLRHGIIIT